MTALQPAAIDADDVAGFAAGTHGQIYTFLGAHPDADGCTFRVWAPAAQQVSVIGDFNGWDGDSAPLTPSDAGVWSGYVSGAAPGAIYKYRIVGRDGAATDRADPVAFAAEEPPRTGSKIWNGGHDWADDEWMATRGPRNRYDAPISVYEVHLGSWRYEPEGYRGLAHQLADYLDETGFTHVELLPVMEHPFYGSWGYQTTGYFAPTARYGEPEDLMYLIDLLHQRGYGVLLDWVPSHFPTDGHGLARFDGTYLYEHADPRLGFHPDWKSAIFNYGRAEVRSFLLSSARLWLDRFHVDGLRVDAVASMLYRDYSRREGEWLPNEHGGRENLEAMSLLRELNESLYLHHPDVQIIAEESTAWPGVSKPTANGGLGFGFKWDMGWMHDTLEFFAKDPVHRNWHLGELTFRMVYAFHEHFVLALSHDEVVHGKGSLLDRQPGDRWQRFANLRLLYGYQFALPGKKLLFMGSEFASPNEWDHEAELPWEVLAQDDHRGVKDYVRALNDLYRSEPALHRVDHDPSGFGWSVADDGENSVLAFFRQAPGERPVLAVMNFTPTPRYGYQLGVPAAGDWTELISGDDVAFGGSGVGNPETLATTDEPRHGHQHSLTVDLPPLAAIYLAPKTPPTP